MPASAIILRLTFPNMTQPAADNTPELSIVVPALDEEANVGPLVERVAAEMTKAIVNAELIVVDDGSRDQTLARLQELAATRPWLRVLHRAQPRGQSAAIWAGIHAARAPFIATLDADLQNDPADLPAMLQTVRSGEADMAQGLRAKRRDNVVRKASSWVGRTARRLILGDNIRDTGCSTRVVRADIARQLPLQFAGLHRFMPVYARILGAKVVEMPVRHQPRTAGVTKYGIMNRAIVGLIDCFAVRWMRRRLRSTAAEEAVIDGEAARAQEQQSNKAAEQQI
jgi:glycosyltransferase involved in cell wall biosynthesis